MKQTQRVDARKIDEFRVTLQKLKQETSLKSKEVQKIEERQKELTRQLNLVRDR